MKKAQYEAPELDIVTFDLKQNIMYANGENPLNDGSLEPYNGESKATPEELLYW